MLFFRRRKRRKLLQQTLIPEQDAILRARVPLYARLPADVRMRLAGPTQVLLAEKHFEGCRGLDVTDTMSLMIAAQAALLQLRPGADHYPALDTILVYPDTFVVDHPREDEHGFVTVGEDELAGESWQRGVVILSWRDIERDLGPRAEGTNVVLHEFAHQLDDENDRAEGAPRLPAALVPRWAEAFGEAYTRHRRRVARGREVLFDADAAEDPAEFFATAVELFFTAPRALREEFGAVSEVLALYLAVDPGGW